MRVESVSLTLGQPVLNAVVTDDGGGRRAIRYVWFERETQGVPPEGWPEALQGECEFQRADEMAQARGTALP